YDGHKPNRPPRLWRVLQREGNASAFNGYRWQPSDWSSVSCLRCGAVWRTKANYVQFLDNATEEDRTRPSAHTVSRDGKDVTGVHARFMESMGREPYDMKEER